MNVKLNLAQLEAGTYNQDEFYGLLKQFGPNNAAGIATFLYVDTTSLSNVNFSRIALVPWNTDYPV